MKGVGVTWSWSVGGRYSTESAKDALSPIVTDVMVPKIARFAHRPCILVDKFIRIF